ncbi:MAG: two-component system cell cycle sensor histidine kinase/response regulator CckA [Verrucomicrobiales bacterium]|jgi:two-component system cell cycle sensor histidine kinase/response regulator CckA
MTFEELQGINYHWRLAIDQVEEGILLMLGDIHDLDQVRVVFANRSLEERLGLDPGRLEGVAVADLLAQEQRDAFRAGWFESISEGSYKGRFSLRTLPGGIVDADWSISSRPAGTDREADHTATLKWVVGSEMADLAPDIAVEGAEELSSDHAFELNKADTIAHIAKGIVHDFNNSLTAIRGHLETAMPDTVAGSSVQVALEHAMEAALTTTDLCKRLLNYAKGRRSAKRPCSVVELAQQAVSITGFGSNVTCKRLIQPDVWPVLADGIEIVQVINNLLMNGQQAMPNGGTIALVAENVPLEENSPLGLPPGNYVALTVRDRGVGIPEDQRGRIFEALYTTKSDGSGLGLATCAQIVSAHEGYIDVHSVPNRGSEFIVYLPAAPNMIPDVTSKDVADTLAESGNETFMARPSLPSQLKILVLEDQVRISQIAQMYLEKLGHEVVCAINGQEAIAAHREAWQMGAPFDVGIIDMTLPGGMNGEDAFRELRSIDPHMVGIATSGSMDQDSLSFYQQKGFATILPKPFPLKMLSDVVQEAMLFHTV